ncbi:hypothetical protein BC739_000339 [Kutzneria viridogrisea]|uniref:Uncharacterized protein n=2 Tax=Kutzneria TaxID=43356 RepID=W5WMA4_9PSEU|nr:hypothetical protein [Kutzneria albida]AHH99304.1 hypothetical protein KALB_5943 [Kutzneria albida DSM 43870]MBA8923142.1 hypothetical protein [Kutzneria viridogrisea]
MESDVLELQALPETEVEPLGPVMCCDTDWTSGQCTDIGPRCHA